MIPIGTKILVQPIAGPKEKITEGGIILEGNAAKESYDRGIVIAVSEDLVGCRVKAGYTILYDPGAGSEVEGGLLMEYRHVAAII